MKVTKDKYNDIDVRPLAAELAAALGGAMVNGFSQSFVNRRR